MTRCALEREAFGSDRFFMLLKRSLGRVEPSKRCSGRGVRCVSRRDASLGPPTPISTSPAGGSIWQPIRVEVTV